jgi:hypothetical protein
MEPTPFYPPELTDRSRQVLDTVVAAAPEIVLIGGWATWVRTGGPMSHDIDAIVTHDQLAAITNLGTDTSESHHLGGRKWRTIIDGIHIDLYVPYQSRLGQALQLRVEDLAHHTERIQAWTVLALPAHVASKLAALIDRPHTAPGVKDRYELAALILQGTDLATTVNVIAEASSLPPAGLADTIQQGLDHLTDGSLPPAIRRDLQRALKPWRGNLQQLGLRTDEDQIRRDGPRRR